MRKKYLANFKRYAYSYWLLLNINIEKRIGYGRFAVDFYFVDKCVYISKTVGETSKVTIQGL